EEQGAEAVRPVAEGQGSEDEEEQFDERVAEEVGQPRGAKGVLRDRAQRKHDAVDQDKDRQQDGDDHAAGPKERPPQWFDGVDAIHTTQLPITGVAMKNAMTSEAPSQARNMADTIRRPGTGALPKRIHI